MRAPLQTRAAAALLLLVLAAGCPEPGKEPRDPVRLSLSLRTKGSCGISPVLFDASCLSALEVRVLDPAGRTLGTHCVEVQERYESLADLLTAAEPAVSFGSLTSQGQVVFRVTALHDKGALQDAGPGAACERSDRQQSWLFWGESRPVDLGDADKPDAGALSIVVPIDCRDCQDGCAALATPQCPAALPVSYCVPFSLGLSCERRCDADEECFEGSHVCDAESERCNPRLGHPETGNTGGFCYPCSSSADCDLEYECVAAPGQTEGLCALRCPDSRCLDGATCKRLGSELRRLDDVGATGDGGVADGG